MQEAFRELVQRRPEITVPELAEELRVIDELGDVVVTLRASGHVMVIDLQTPDASAGRDAAVSGLPPATAAPAGSGLPSGSADPDVWGPAPSREQVEAAYEAGEQARREALAAALDGALTREQAAARVGVTSQAVSERLRTGKLSALRRGREWRFPAWQFADDGTLPALAELIAAWPGTPLALTVWATTPNVDLSGRTPAQQLARRGGPPRVLELAEALGAAAW